MVPKKKIIGIILIMMMVITYMPSEAFAEGENIVEGTCGTCTWEISGTTLTISSGELDDWGDKPPWHEDNVGYMANYVEEIVLRPIGRISYPYILSHHLPKNQYHFHNL